MSQSGKSGLSKSLILKGLQCQKALWLAKNPPAFDFPTQPDLEARFAAGTKVGILAQQLFPGGTEVPYEGLSFPAQLTRTRELIDNGTQVIYEASFSFSAIFVKVDILVKDGDQWQIYEVKMGTGVKSVNLDDVAVQQYVLNGCGLSVSKAFLVHINNSYVRQGGIEVGRLFHAEEISAKVCARQQSLPEIMREFRQTMAEHHEPKVDIGPHCTDPYACDYIPYCWQHIPENSVFALRGNGLKKFDYYQRGLIRFEDLPLADLNPAQQQQVEATLKQQDFIDPLKVKAFIDSLWYPLCHLDFESFNTPIPKFDGTRPYQQVPFQYSIHVQSTAGAKPQHFEYLARPNIDPRRELIEQLLTVIPENACILTYNQTFEKGVLRNLADLFPDLAQAINLRLPNLRDLMALFRRRDVYRWRMHGSYSIKEVLPAMVPELSYAEMEIADGMAASQAYHEMCRLDDPLALAELRKAMLAYCALDTLAMVKILETLLNID
ncbi:DUF2779 domain-containing protein [Geopsychrobacter electrodiphilus]|uniref:DUF2779 domain-containing protein n=1 Tax=Geopsychrobacter electrodiphilus TaxID=225196 RepID=UPI000366E47A|nr:DUF2779 domain-containing protein [Geopsychrobacter electrodiphilus]